jgi:hypothetical protein
MLWFAALLNGVLRGARANAPATLAENFRARASRRCAQPFASLFISPSPNKKPSQTYVLAALYKL